MQTEILTYAEAAVRIREKLAPYSRKYLEEFATRHGVHLRALVDLLLERERKPNRRQVELILKGLNFHVELMRITYFQVSPRPEPEVEQPDPNPLPPLTY